MGPTDLTYMKTWHLLLISGIILSRSNALQLASEDKNDEDAWMAGAGICPASDSENDDYSEPEYFPHPRNCSLYFECFQGALTVGQCLPHLHFSSTEKTCQFPHKAACFLEQKSATITITEAQRNAHTHSNNNHLQTSGNVKSMTYDNSYLFTSKDVTTHVELSNNANDKQNGEINHKEMLSPIPVIAKTSDDNLEKIFFKRMRSEANKINENEKNSTAFLSQAEIPELVLEAPHNILQESPMTRTRDDRDISSAYAAVKSIYDMYLKHKQEPRKENAGNLVLNEDVTTEESSFPANATAAHKSSSANNYLPKPSSIRHHSRHYHSPTSAISLTSEGSREPVTIPSDVRNDNVSIDVSSTEIVKSKIIDSSLNNRSIEWDSPTDDESTKKNPSFITQSINKTVLVETPIQSEKIKTKEQAISDFLKQSTTEHENKNNTESGIKPETNTLPSATTALPESLTTLKQTLLSKIVKTYQNRLQTVEMKEKASNSSSQTDNNGAEKQTFDNSSMIKEFDETVTNNKPSGNFTKNTSPTRAETNNSATQNEVHENGFQNTNNGYRIRQITNASLFADSSGMIGTPSPAILSESHIKGNDSLQSHAPSIPPTIATQAMTMLQTTETQLVQPLEALTVTEAKPPLTEIIYDTSQKDPLDGSYYDHRKHHNLNFHWPLLLRTPAWLGTATVSTIVPTEESVFAAKIPNPDGVTYEKNQSSQNTEDQTAAITKLLNDNLENHDVKNELAVSKSSNRTLQSTDFKYDDEIISVQKHIVNLTKGASNMINDLKTNNASSKLNIETGKNIEQREATNYSASYVSESVTLKDNKPLTPTITSNNYEQQIAQPPLKNIDLGGMAGSETKLQEKKLKETFEEPISTNMNNQIHSTTPIFWQTAEYSDLNVSSRLKNIKATSTDATALKESSGINPLSTTRPNHKKKHKNGAKSSHHSGNHQKTAETDDLDESIMF